MRANYYKLSYHKEDASFYIHFHPREKLYSSDTLNIGNFKISVWIFIQFWKYVRFLK